MLLREVMRCNEFSTQRNKTGVGTWAATSMGSRGEMGSPEKAELTAHQEWLSYPQHCQGMHILRLLLLPHFCKQL